MVKFALCIQGGGSRGAYGAGVLDVLMRNGYWAEEVIGTSAGALIGCNYVSQDIGRSGNMMLTMMSDRHFMKPLNYLKKGSIFDFHYLVYDLSRKGLPFNFDYFAKNPCKFYVVSSSCTKGEARYFEKRDPEFWTALAASASLPLTSKPVFVHGEPCLDGGVSCPIGFSKAIADGYEKVVVVATREKGYRKPAMKESELLLAKQMYRKFPSFASFYEKSHAVYNAQMDELDSLSKEGRIFVIYPSIPPKISHASKSKKKIQRLLDLGQKDMETQIPFLKMYLSK